MCGPNEGGGAVSDAGPEETQGITADGITVGTVSDPGFEGRPGLNQEIFDAGEAFVEWCNAAGGINGKQLTLNLRDAAVTEYQPVLEQSCEEDFAIVGSGAVQDNFWPEVGAACGLIDIAGFSVTPDKAGLAGRDPIEARSVQPVPNPSDQYQVGSYLIIDAEYPDAPARTGILYGDLETTAIQAERVQAGLEEIGHTIVHTAAYNILGEANWAPFAAGPAGRRRAVAAVRRRGRELRPAPPGHGRDRLPARGHRPGRQLLRPDLGRRRRRRRRTGCSCAPCSTRSRRPTENPAVQQYIDHVEAIDGKVASLGTQAWSAWLLFAQAARDCDLEDNLTRSCVLEGAASVTDWTGGGLHAPTSPGTNEPPECTIVLQIEDGAFTRCAPDEGFDCGEDSDEPYVVDIDIG